MRAHFVESVISNAKHSGAVMSKQAVQILKLPTHSPIFKHFFVMYSYTNLYMNSTTKIICRV